MESGEGNARRIPIIAPCREYPRPAIPARVTVLASSPFAREMPAPNPRWRAVVRHGHLEEHTGEDDFVPLTRSDRGLMELAKGICYKTAGVIMSPFDATAACSPIGKNRSLNSFDGGSVPIKSGITETCSGASDNGGPVPRSWAV